MGSPLVWWTSLGALSYLGVIIAARRRPSEAVIVVVTGFSVLYLPLLALTLVRSFIFLYYLLPSVPFMCLAVALVSTQWAHSLSTRAIVVAFSAGALVLFAFFYPVLTATPLSRQEMEAREWFHDCELPPGKAAPDGWCWR